MNNKKSKIVHMLQEDGTIKILDLSNPTDRYEYNKYCREEMKEAEENNIGFGIHIGSM